MKKWVTIIALSCVIESVSLAQTAACTPRRSGSLSCNILNADRSIAGSYVFQQLPNSSDEAVFDVYFPGVAQQLKLSVNLWMSMGSGGGHGSSPVTVEQVGAGHYRVHDAYFVMDGVWKIHFELSGPAGTAARTFVAEVEI